MDRAEVGAYLDTLALEGRHGELEGSLPVYLPLLFALENPCKETMQTLLERSQAYLQAGNSLPRHVQEYLLERLLLATERAPPSAFGFSKDENTRGKHYEIVSRICEKAYECRHKPDPVKSAIQRLIGDGSLDVSVEYAQKLYRQYGNHVWEILFMMSTKGSPRRDFYWKHMPEKIREHLIK